MRTAILVLAAMALSACDSGDVPSPADRMGGAAPVQPVDEGRVALHSEGLVVGAEAFYFAAGQVEVATAIAEVLGKAEDSGTLSECGAGPMEYARFANGLTVNFQNGNLVGWYLEEASEQIAVDADVAIDMPAEELASLPGYSAIEDSTLGEEFMVADQLAGFVEEGRVAMIYAGVQCFFR